LDHGYYFVYCLLMVTEDRPVVAHRDGKADRGHNSRCYLFANHITLLRQKCNSGRLSVTPETLTTEPQLFQQ